LKTAGAVVASGDQGMMCIAKATNGIRATSVICKIVKATAATVTVAETDMSSPSFYAANDTSWEATVEYTTAGNLFATAGITTAGAIW
jgi:hypothetical protein